MNGANAGGWIKLHRRILSSPVWANPNLTRFWIWCLLKATHVTHSTRVGYVEVRLEPGQFVFSRSSACTETGLSEKTVRTCLETLKSGDDPSLAQKSTSAFSVITVLKGKGYQDDEIENDQPATSKRPAYI